ncbi:beta-propeller domain-containing protein [Hymenobacter yonginensis]|uniref:SMP-30/gluconolactonase/LRE family protein n=1 Tax=Hymenobacter yonginensis TaxID=748197 RepID=A0ABY7PH89_9BACT|nr:SMP-30/gluconolactonase/LRE family protein [Hymenobacter yonginensis]WBO82850.1 SMP-30/gluconolactonase/LRE family protein [Hymenobacter yonginensis]
MPVRSFFTVPAAGHMRHFAAATLLLGGLLTASCSNDDDDDMATPTAPDSVAFTVSNLYPEGVQYDAKNSRFLVSSLTTGNVGQVKDDGTYSVFAPGAGAGIISAVGMNLDDSRNRLLVASSNGTLRNVAKLVSFNRDNGQVLFNTDLGTLRSAPNHFANDIAVDNQGNAYVTDSFAPVIYKVDPQGVASVFLDNQQLAAPAGAFGLNGIVFHPDGYLLVAKSDEGALFKVPISNPTGFTRVTTTGLDLRAADGLLLQDNNTLQVVTNSQSKVYRLSTSNSWAAATLNGTFATLPQYPTTLARRGADSYVLYANLDKIMQTPPVSVFTIGKVRF